MVRGSCRPSATNKGETIPAILPESQGEAREMAAAAARKKGETLQAILPEAQPQARDQAAAALKRRRRASSLYQLWYKLKARPVTKPPRPWVRGPVLASRSHESALPTSYRTLAELARLPAPKRMKKGEPLPQIFAEAQGEAREQAAKGEPVQEVIPELHGQARDQAAAAPRRRRRASSFQEIFPEAQGNARDVCSTYAYLGLAGRNSESLQCTQ